MARLLAFFMLLASPAYAVDVPSWLADRADDAKWLAEAPDQPRALLTMEEGFAEVVLYLPEQSPDGVVKTVMNYDVWKRTEAVEAAFVTDGAFFTATRLLGQFNPTITDSRLQNDGKKLVLSWKHTPKERALPWLEAHRDDLDRAIKTAGLDRELDEYLEEVEARYHVIADVDGSHTFEGGFYRYSQAAKTSSRFAQGLVDSLGKKMQVAAALKAACYSTGRYDWAGPSGDRGPEFETRGNMGGSMRPSK